MAWHGRYVHGTIAHRPPSNRMFLLVSEKLASAVSGFSAGVDAVTQKVDHAPFYPYNSYN